MSRATGRSNRVTAALMRCGLLSLGGLTIVGAAIELGTLRHWDSIDQPFPWICLIVITVPYPFLVLRPTPTIIWLARWSGVAIVVAAVYGIWEHVSANRHLGVLDQTWGEKWDTLSTLEQFWRVIDGSVGPSPLVAPGALATVGVCMVLACFADPRSPNAGIAP